MIREIAYNAVKDSLKTGDLILFHGVQTTSKLIELALGFSSTDYVANGYCPDGFNKGDNMPSLQPFHFSDGARLNK